MSYTDAEILEKLKLARDKIVDALAAGEHVAEWHQGDVVVRREASWQVLKELRAQIKALERDIAAENRATSGQVLAAFRNQPT